MRGFNVSLFRGATTRKLAAVVFILSLDGEKNVYWGNLGGRNGRFVAVANPRSEKGYKKRCLATLRQAEPIHSRKIRSDRGIRTGESGKWELTTDETCRRLSRCQRPKPVVKAAISIGGALRALATEGSTYLPYLPGQALPT